MNSLPLTRPTSAMSEFELNMIMVETIKRQIAISENIETRLLKELVENSRKMKDFDKELVKYEELVKPELAVFQ